jgi:hypothetical protein
MIFLQGAPMLDLVYICRFDYLSQCHLREEQAAARAHLSCTPDEAAALIAAKRQERLKAMACARSPGGGMTPRLR